MGGSSPSKESKNVTKSYFFIHFDTKIIILIMGDGKWCTLGKLFFRVLQETAQGKYNAYYLRNTIHTSDQDWMIVIMIILMIVIMTMKSGNLN